MFSVRNAVHESSASEPAWQLPLMCKANLGTSLVVTYHWHPEDLQAVLSTTTSAFLCHQYLMKLH